MLVGFNTNITFKGTVYHVQTEDNGLKNPVLITLLYQKGAILASKKTNYSNLLSENDWQEKVTAIMKRQHKSMIKELTSGRYTGDAGLTDEEAHDELSDKDDMMEKSLDDILIDFIIGKEKVS